MQNNVKNISEREYAKDLKRRAAEILEPMLDLCNEAQEAGMVLQFQIGPGPTGRFVVQSVAVIKHL